MSKFTYIEEDQLDQTFDEIKYLLVQASQYLKDLRTVNPSNRADYRAVDREVVSALKAITKAEETFYIRLS